MTEAELGYGPPPPDADRIYWQHQARSDKINCKSPPEGMTAQQRRWYQDALRELEQMPSL